MLGEFKLHGANLREPLLAGGHQQLHADVPKKFDDDWWVTNAIVAFDDITAHERAAARGARLAPLAADERRLREHPRLGARRRSPPRSRPGCRTTSRRPTPASVHVTCPRGTVIVINSSLWHGGTRNAGRLTAPGAAPDLYPARTCRSSWCSARTSHAGLYARMSPAHRFLLDIEPLAEGR